MIFIVVFTWSSFWLHSSAHAGGFAHFEPEQEGEQRPKATPAKLPAIPKLSNKTVSDLLPCNDMLETAPWETSRKKHFDVKAPGNVSDDRGRLPYSAHGTLLLNYGDPQKRGFLVTDGPKTYFVPRRDGYGYFFIALPGRNKVLMKANSVSHSYPQNKYEVHPWSQNDEDEKKRAPTMDAKEVKDDDESVVGSMKDRLALILGEFVNEISSALFTLTLPKHYEEMDKYSEPDRALSRAEEEMEKFGDPARTLEKIKQCQAAIAPKDVGALVEKLEKEKRWQALYESSLEVLATKKKASADVIKIRKARGIR